MSETKEAKKVTPESIVEALKKEFPEYKFYLQVRTIQDKDVKPTQMYSIDVTEEIYLDEYEEESAEVLFYSLKGRVEEMTLTNLIRKVKAKKKPERPVRKRFSRTVNGRVLYGDYEDKSTTKSMGVKRFKV